VRLAVALAALSFAGTCALPAGAEPSLWSRAKNPNARAEARLLRGIERMLDAEDQARSDPEFANHFARAAVAMIDLARLPAPEDPRLCVLAARALLDADVGRGAQSEALLERAAGVLPEGALLGAAFYELGRARAARGDSRGARDAATRAFDLALDEEARARALYARAGASLALSDPLAAARDYERAARTTSNELLELRARYGVAVSLERRGDLPGAFSLLDKLAGAKLPLSRYPSTDPLELPGGFEPAYEVHYVRALAAMARSQSAAELAERRGAAALAAREWRNYLDAAAPSGPWVAHARALSSRNDAELRRLGPPAPARSVH